MGGAWHVVTRCDVRARVLADRHYSRQTPGARDFLNNGQTLCMVTDDALAVWGVLLNRAPNSPEWRWRVAIFRNEPPPGEARPVIQSSELVREGTDRTYTYWRHHYGGLPEPPLRTEVDRDKTRRKRDPGRCFIKAGWRVVGETTRGLVLLEAPPPAPLAVSAQTHREGERFDVTVTLARGQDGGASAEARARRGAQ